MPEIRKTDPETGLRSIDPYYLPVMHRGFGSAVAYRLRPRVNDPRLGVLLPETYLPVIAQSAVGARFTEWSALCAARDAARLAGRGVSFDWLGVPAPVEVVMAPGFPAQLAAAFERERLSPGGLCLELPMALLYEEKNAAARALSDLSALGFRTLLCDFGGELCPVARLASLRPDLVELSRETVRALASEEPSEREMALAVLAAAGTQDVTLLAGNIDRAEQLAALPAVCELYAGKAAGRPKKPASIR